MLPPEEYVEQTYFFRSLGERMKQETTTQDLLLLVKQEILATSKLPMAIDFMCSEMKLHGGFASAMRRLPHYFTSFQSFVVGEAESDRSRFDFNMAVEILQREADYRAKGATPQGAFLFQFEALCRNRLGYPRGLDAMAGDPIYDDDWRRFILAARKQIGMVDIADLIFVRSQYYIVSRTERNEPVEKDLPPVLFGEKEGRIALANRRKDPKFLFAALQRHLNYPLVPRIEKTTEARHVLPLLLRRVERLETRLKLVEEEQKGGIDITRFYGRQREAEQGWQNDSGQNDSRPDNA